MIRTPRRVPRTATILLAGAIALAGCTVDRAGSPSQGGVASPSVQLSPNASTATGQPVFMRVVVPPAPGPVKPFRGEMVQEVYVADGLVSMFFRLNNVGEEPVTFLNTLYDYEPTQLYTPAVRLEWKEGGNAVYTRAGRFFPSPAIVQPGRSAIYIMGGQPVTGAGTPADLVTHIKYCPTRGMDDIPGVPLQVSGLRWTADPSGGISVSGLLTETSGERRNKAPTVGIAFFDEQDRFIGAVVASTGVDPVLPNRPASFTLNGRGVAVVRIARAEGYAFIP